MNPYSFQELAVDHASGFLAGAKPGERQLYASPTGTGKSFMELGVQARVPGSWILTPKVEIVAGLLSKQGLDVGELSEDALFALAAEHRISTVVRLRNRLLQGGLETPVAIIVDEAHHETAETYQQIDLLCGLAPAVGFTASPYRGTPRSTAAFRQRWGEPVWILTYPEAVARGVLSFPTCRIVPVLDDDEVAVSNGEFVVKEVEDATRSAFDRIAGIITPFYDGSSWDRPSMLAVPSVDIALSLARFLPASVAVIGTTPHRERVAAFESMVNRRTLLVQVAVVGEGVDLPIRRLVDLSPAISPVKWVQQFGRITRPVRPGELPPEYVCCNRNLLRHAYLLDGCLPPSIIADGQKFFGAGKRAGMRVVGLEGLGRFKGVEVPFAGGVEGLCYSLSSYEGGKLREYFALAHPAKEEVLWARRESGSKSDGTRSYGKWSRCEPPDGVEGFQSVRPSEVSAKQSAWWTRSAEFYGLDPTAKVSRKNFAVLPVLSDLGVRLK